jgi:hypothetical protein
VSKKQFLAENGASGSLSRYVKRYTGEFGPTLFGAAEQEWNEGGSRLDDLEPEFTGEFVGEAGGSHLWNRQAACGDDQCGRSELTGSGVNVELSGCALDGYAASLENKFYAGSFALELKHVEDLAGGVIAEELAQCLFVPLDSVALDKFEEVLRLIESQSRFGEVRIRGDEVSRSAMNIGEVAAASARDEDLAAGLGIVFEEEDSPVALTGGGGAHETGGASAKDDDVEFTRCGRHCIDCRRAGRMSRPFRTRLFDAEAILWRSSDR